MKKIKLFEEFVEEKFILPQPKALDALERLIEKLGVEYITAGINAIYHWFSGRTMGRGENEDLLEVFRAIGKVYHKPVPNQKLYRAIHLRLPEDMMNDDDILNITNADTGPKGLQSWSTNMRGAEWFFNHFAKEQNHRDVPREDAAWVLAKLHVNNIEQIITFEECFDFLTDAKAAHIDGAEDMINYLYEPDAGLELLKQHEIICYVQNDAPIEVIKVLVPTKKF